MESRQLLIDDLRIYSDAIITALKQDKLREAKEYLTSLRDASEATSGYLDSHISFDYEAENVANSTPSAAAATEADRAAISAKIAHGKFQHLMKSAKETKEEAKRLKKAADFAKKESEKARKAAEKAEKAESKAQKEADKAADQATKASQSARRS